MAFRIEESVVSGEIDNRVKGSVRGRIWVHGREEPVVLELKGNAHPDLAGCLLTFTNPLKTIPHHHLDALTSLQQGCVGDITASRKVRVYDVPLEEAMEMYERKEKPPEHMANCLYVEWYSEANGRVVIESADYHLTISAPEWRMTREEEEQRAEDAAQAMQELTRKLNEAIEEHQRGQKDPEEPWDEYDYEKFMKESDARTTKYMELLDKYGDSEEAEAKIAEEMGWTRGREEEAEEEEDDNDERMSVEEINAICESAANEPPPEPDPAREGIDWILTEDGEIAHPLQHRCFLAAMKYWKQLDELGLDELEDKDLEKFISELQITGAKLAGALNTIAEDRGTVDPPFTVAYLKRGLDHLHKSQSGLEGLAPKKLIPENMLREARQELFELREGILKLMDEFRGR
jgi:hypothetical protein